MSVLRLQRSFKCDLCFQIKHRIKLQISISICILLFQKIINDIIYIYINIFSFFNHQSSMIILKYFTSWNPLKYPGEYMSFTHLVYKGNRQKNPALVANSLTMVRKKHNDQDRMGSAERLSWESVAPLLHPHTGDLELH